LNNSLNLIILLIMRKKWIKYCNICDNYHFIGTLFLLYWANYGIITMLKPQNARGGFLFK